jgi:alpha-tubulin suppressor-like RCC1 family protein
MCLSALPNNFLLFFEFKKQLYPIRDGCVFSAAPAPVSITIGPIRPFLGVDMPAARFGFGLMISIQLGALLVSCGSPDSVPTGTPTDKPATATLRMPSPSQTVDRIEDAPAAPLASGANFACAQTISHGIACWGNNRSGQLGNGTQFSSTLPQPVSRMTSGVKSIVAGWSHACALRTGGGLECWGSNAKGQLGDGTNADSFSPVAVFGLAEGVKAVAAGTRHTCVLMETGAVKCWGENASGGVGDGTNINRNTPVEVPGLEAGVKALDAGAGHTCTLMSDGSVKCWGWNPAGQIGNGTRTDSRLPVDVSGLSGPVRAIAAGDQHTCALLEDGSVRCWGANASGQLGDGSRIRSSTPVAVGGLSGVVAVSAGGAHTCALLADGPVWCWGDDQTGQLGDGGYENRSSPVEVTGLTGAVEFISAGYGHTCAVMRDRGIQCWGWNTEGQLGDGTVQSRRIPGNVTGYAGGIAAISVGWSNTCALQSPEGGIRCWGLNDGGQLGDGTREDSLSPVEADGLGSGRIAVAVGGGHVCALSGTGGVNCWGRNEHGQLGNGTVADLNSPVDVAGLPEEIAALALGKAHACVLTVRGGVKCWGANESGQLGDGTTADSGIPVYVLGLAEGVSAIAAGASHTCALGRNGALKCWGSNQYGQLGDATLENRSAPVDVSGLTAGVDSIAAGGSHTCAIASGVKLMCWGWNAYGQLGDSTPTDRNAPVDVKWLAGTAATVAAGADFTCVILRTGFLRCWGNNEFGQLGDGTTTAHHTPISVQGLKYKVLMLAAGYYTTCVVTVDGNLKCWGNNLYGQLGNGAVSNSNVPVDVVGLGF